MFDSGAFVGEGLEELVCREADIASRLYNFDTALFQRLNYTKLRLRDQVNNSLKICPVGMMNCSYLAIEN